MMEERSLARPSVVEPLSQPSATEGMDIRALLDIIRRRRAAFIYVFLGVLLLGIFITVTAQRIYKTSTRLVVPSSQGSSVTLLANQSPIAHLLLRAEPEPVSTQMERLGSGKFIEDAKEKAQLRTKPGEMPPKVQVDNLKTDAGQPTEIIEITVQGSNPEAIATLANTMVALHKETMNKALTAGLSTTIEKVKALFEQTDEERKAALQALIDFRSEHKMVQMTAERDARAKQYVDADARLREAKSKVTSTSRHLQQVRSTLKKEAPFVKQERIVDNPARAAMRDRLAQLRVKEIELSSTFNEGTPELTTLREEIEELQKKLAAEPPSQREPVEMANENYAALKKVESELSSDLMKFTSELNAAQAAFDGQRGLVDDLGPAEIQLAALQTHYERLEADHNVYRESLRDLTIRAGAPPPSVNQIEEAETPSRPVSPRVPVNLAVTLMLALCLGAGVAFLQEYMDDRVNDPGDIERISGLPMLGHVPLMDAGSPRTLAQLPSNSQVAEAYRGLRSSVGFASIDHPLRRLVVTSASKGEGKSLTSVNLAQAMALDGKRVILVDADLRRPSLHRILALPSNPGLSDLLAGTKSIEEVLQPTGVDNLQAICSGPIPPNPAELIGSVRFEEIMTELEERCDLVLLDTPPCIPVTDPLIMAARADGVVLVLNAGNTRKNAVRHVCTLLERARARTVGVVFNCVQANKGGYYYYTYYQYSGDGYYADAAAQERRRRNGRSADDALPGPTRSRRDG